MNGRQSMYASSGQVNLAFASVVRCIEKKLRREQGPMRLKQGRWSVVRRRRWMESANDVSFSQRCFDHVAGPSVHGLHGGLERVFQLVENA